MAINRKDLIKVQAGLPTREEMLAGRDDDNLDAVVVGEEGSEPASIREGEFIISIPAIIGLGDGDFEQGIKMLDELHTQLRDKGLGMMEKGSLAGVE